MTQLSVGIVAKDLEVLHEMVADSDIATRLGRSAVRVKRSIVTHGWMKKIIDWKRLFQEALIDHILGEMLEIDAISR